MTKYCSHCTRTGRFGERVEMDHIGSHRKDGEKVSIYQCPVCDSVKAETTHRNGLSTTRSMSSDEVAALPRAGGGLLMLGLIAAGLIALGAGSSSKS